MSCCECLFHVVFLLSVFALGSNRKEEHDGPGSPNTRAGSPQRKRAAEGKASDSVRAWHGLACRSVLRRAGFAQVEKTVYTTRTGSHGPAVLAGTWLRIARVVMHQAERGLFRRLAGS